jgi:hypothetical protein
MSVSPALLLARGGLPVAGARLPAWPAGTVLRLLRDLQGRWQVGPISAGRSWDAASLVEELGEARLAGLLDAGESAVLLRVLSSQPRLLLEVLDEPAGVALAGPADEVPGGLLEAQRQGLPPWQRADARGLLPQGSAAAYLRSSAPQDWAEASLPALRRGAPPAEPFDRMLWIRSSPLPVAGDEPGLSLLLPWRGQLMELEFSGRSTALDLQLTLSSPLALALARARWPHWDGVLAGAGARVRRCRWRQRRLQRPEHQEPLDADADLLRLAAELLWSL